MVERDEGDHAYVRITALGRDVIEHPQYFRQDPVLRTKAIYVSGGVGEMLMGDSYVNSGQVGTFFRQAHVHDMTLHQTAAATAANSSDLATQLATLRRALQRVDAYTGARGAEIAAIAAAEKAVQQGGRSRAITHLAQAGDWARLTWRGDRCADCRRAAHPCLGSWRHGGALTGVDGAVDNGSSRPCLCSYT